MKIKYLELSAHPVLGNFTYSFEDDKQITMLVGGNGSGKTRFIQLIHLLLDSGFRIHKVPELSSSVVRIGIELHPNELKLLGITFDNLLLEMDHAHGSSSNAIKIFNPSNGADLTEDLHQLFWEGEFKNVLREKTRFSNVEINYTETKVERVGSFDIDKEVQTKSPRELSQRIADLLVSLKSEDDSAFREFFRSGNKPEDFEGKLDRFKIAYSHLFKDEVEFVDIKLGKNEREVVFKNLKNNKEFSINNLSSGQQQVVYRIGYLLENLNIVEGGVILIDEPEISLHPQWQVGYIEFLKLIFGENIQIIIATHSPYIVKSGIDNKDVSISKLSSHEGNLNNENLHHTSKLGRATFAEVNYKAFDIPSEEFHSELYLALQRTYSPEKWDVSKKPTPWYVDGTPTSLDKVISTKPGITNLAPWTDVNSGKACTETLMTFIRNIINHGDDAVSRGRGRKYKPEELKQSIEEMLSLL